MKKITLHWDVGPGTVYDNLWKSYHFAVDQNGVWYENPNHPPESNSRESVRAGTYLRHCGGGNSDNIGVAVLGMGGGSPKHQPYRPGNPTIKLEQMEAAAAGVADLCELYGIPVTPETVFLHCEFDSKRGSQSTGKWDVCVWDPHSAPMPFDTAGRKWRDMVRDKLRGDPLATDDPVADLIEEASDTITSSKTNWSVIGQAAAAVGAFASENQALAFACLALVGVFGLYILYSRQRKAKAAERARAVR